MLLLERLLHFARVAVVAFFVLAFVTFSTATRPDWFGVTVGTVIGLLFGLVFAFGGQWADAEDGGEVKTDYVAAQPGRHSVATSRHIAQ